jgi:hypothetical protein
MKRIIESLAPWGAYGSYLPEEGEDWSQCGWSWDRETGIITDSNGYAEIVVGYAANLSEITQD